MQAVSGHRWWRSAWEEELCVDKPKTLLSPHAPPLYFLENLALKIYNCFFSLKDMFRSFEKIKWWVLLNLNKTKQKLQSVSTQVPFSWALIIVIDNNTELGKCICDLKFLPLETIKKEGRGHFNAALLGFCWDPLSVGCFSVQFGGCHRSSSNWNIFVFRSRAWILTFETFTLQSKQ